MVKKECRTLFLREFTRELVLNSKKPGEEVFSEHPLKEEYEEDNLTSMQPGIEIESPKNISLSDLTFPETRAKIFLPGYHIPRQMQIPPKIPRITAPFPQNASASFSLGKLNPLITDNTVTNIECSGPGKLIIVRVIGKTSTTRISLSEEEIRQVIAAFSQKAKMPIIGGIFKAAVGNIVITAVISDFVGSRFIINKYTPYSILA